AFERFEQRAENLLDNAKPRSHNHPVHKVRFPSHAHVSLTGWRTTFDIRRWVHAPDVKYASDPGRARSGTLIQGDHAAGCSTATEFQVPIVPVPFSGFKGQAAFCDQHRVRPEFVTHRRAAALEELSRLFQGRTGAHPRHARIAELDPVADAAI